LPGDLFRAGSEKKVERLLRTALPGYMVSAQLMSDPVSGEPIIGAGVNGEASQLGGGLYAGIETHEVTTVIARVLKAAAQASKYPLRVMVVETSGDAWVYDHWRDDQPWLSE